MTQEDIDAATTNIVFGSRYVPFTQEFEYLGSQVTTDLNNVTDINNRLCQAKGQAAALGTFFCSSAETWSKGLIFLASLTSLTRLSTDSKTVSARQLKSS
jgi:hypothetical protein